MAGAGRGPVSSQIIQTLFPWGVRLQRQLIAEAETKLYLHSMAFSSDLNVLGRLLRKFCMLFKASMAVPKSKWHHLHQLHGI